MKKMNTKAWFNWRKTGVAGLLAAGLALFSLGNSYGQCTTVTTLPWTEDFSSGALPSSCWTNTNAGNSTSTYSYWRFSGTPDYGTQNNGKTPGTFAWVDASSPYAGIHEVTLITPSIDVSSLTTPYLRFEWFKDNSDLSYGNNQLSVKVSSNGGTTWTSVFADTTNDPNWRLVGIPLAGYANSTIQIKFVVDKDLTGNGYFYDNLLLDDITVMEAPTCFAPVNLAVSGITPTGATIDWHTPFVSPGSGYQYYYNTTGTTPTASTPATASTTDTSVTLTTLNPSTQYYFWARSVCSATDTSEWTSSPLIFRTPQIPATLPYTEDYSGTTSSWSFINDGQTNQWAFGSATGNPGNSMYVSDDGGTSNTYDNTSTSVAQAYRDVVLTAGTNPFNLSFDWKCGGEGTTWDYFRVWIVPTTFEPTAGTQITSSASGGVQLGGNFNDPNSGTSWFSEHFIIPNTYAGDTVRVVFEWRNDGGSGINPPVAIDNVNISVITCATPDNLNADNLTSSSATLTWNGLPTTPANGYQYYYNTTGTTPTATTTPSGSATDTFANISSLTPNTQYYAWVRSVCSSTDTSDWSPAFSFTTPCVSVSTFPWTEGFESLTSLGSTDFPDCWYKENGDWATSDATTYNVAHGGSNYLRDSWSATDEYIWTPPMHLSAGDVYVFSFYMQGDGYTTPNWDIATYVNTAQASPGATQLGADFYPPGNNSSNSGTSPYEQKRFYFAPTTTGDYYFGLKVNASGSPWYVAFDDFSVDQVSCIEPDDLTADNITTTTADINWKTPVITPGTGYDYYYNTTGTPPTAGTTVSGSATDTFASLSNLTQNTTYYVWVRSVCSSSDKSYWSSTPTIFTTECNTASVPYTVPLSTATTPDLPDCMSDQALNPNDNEGWYTDSGSPGSTYGFSGNYLRSDYTGSSDGAVNNWVYTNKINMNAGTYYKVSFKYGNNSSSLPEKLAVAYGRAATADSMSAPVFDDTSITFAGSVDTTVYFMVPTSGAYCIGFHAHSDADQYYLFLSNIVVDSLPTCHVANSLIANNITTTTANLAWFGTALKYRIEYGESGFTLGSGTQVSSATGTYHLAGLNPNTTYDFYVRDVCVPGIDSADWSAVGTFTTLCDTPIVSLGHDTAFCTGGTIVLHTGNSDTGRTILWSDGSSADSLSVNTTGAYYVTVTNQYGCSATDTAHINVKTYPVIDLGNDTTICTGNVLTLDAGTQPFGTTFYWSTTQTSQTIQVSDSGKYKVTADNHGCVSSDSILVSEIAAPDLNGITITQNTDGSYSCSASGVQNSNGYDWDFGDGSPHSTDSAPTHTYVSTGNYTVTLVVSNACGSDSASANIRFIAAGIHQVSLDKDQLKLYPNPARDRVTLKNESRYKMESVSVYNILGQEVFHDHTNSQSEYELNVQGFASGMYNIKITFKDGNWVSRKFEIRK